MTERNRHFWALFTMLMKSADGEQISRLCKPPLFREKKIKKRAFLDFAPSLCAQIDLLPSNSERSQTALHVPTPCVSKPSEENVVCPAEGRTCNLKSCVSESCELNSYYLCCVFILM